MVSSTPTMSTVPTASPDIGNDYVECHIGEEGYVFSDVWVFTEDSYGNKKTPSTITVLGAYVKKRRDIY